MTRKKEEGERIRKVYSARGERGQKMFNFRMDNENWEWLQQQTNKGRYLNELISKDRGNQ